MITTFSLPLTEVPTCYYFFKTLSRKFSASILSTSRAPGALHSIALSKFSRNNHGSKIVSDRNRKIQKIKPTSNFTTRRRNSLPVSLPAINSPRTCQLHLQTTDSLPNVNQLFNCIATEEGQKRTNDLTGGKTCDQNRLSRTEQT